MQNVSSSNSEKALVPKLRFPEFTDEWEENRIGSILKIKHGKDYKNEVAINFKYPVLGTGGIITYIDSFLCDWDCVCIGRKGTIDKPIFMDIPFWSVDTLFYTQPSQNENPKFQYYLFQKINWMKYNEASGVPSLSASTIENIKIHKPQISEQDKIAFFLSLIDKKIQLQQQLIENLKLYKRGVLKYIFSQIKQYKKLYEMCIYQVSNNTYSSISKNNGNYPVYDATGITKYIDQFDIDKNYISIIKDGAGVGRLQFCQSYSTIIGTMGAIIPKKCDPYYLYYSLETIDFRKYIIGSTIPHIYFKDYSHVNIPFVKDSKQKKISFVLRKIDNQIKNYNLILNSMKQLKSGLVQNLFI